MTNRSVTILRFLFVILALCAITRGHACAAIDQTTQDAMNQIDAVTPAPPGRSGTTKPRDTSTSPSLLSLFAPMLIAGAALGMAGGVGGTLVLLRRESLVALAMPQVVAVGAAIGLRFHQPTLPPALVAAAVAVIFLVAARRRMSGAWILPALYVAGLSISFLLIASKGQDVAELQKLFTGIDVAVAPIDAFIATPLLILAAAIMAILSRRWLLIAQAPAAAELAGLHPARWDALFLCLLTVILLLGTSILGVVMVLALLFLPPSVALPWARTIPIAMSVAAMLGVALVGIGFVVANRMSWPLSQTIGAAGFVAVASSHGLAMLKK